MRVPIVVALGLAAAAPFLRAQVPQLARGSRVRVELPGRGGQAEHRESGLLQRLSNDSVYLMPGLSHQGVIDLRNGGTLEVAVATTSRHGAEGFMIGLCAGTATAYAAVSVFGSADARRNDRGFYSLMGALGGGLIGYVWGHSWQRVTWVPVATGGLRVTVAPMAVRISWSS